MPVLGVRRTTLVTEEAFTLDGLGAGERNRVQLIEEGRRVVDVEPMATSIERVQNLKVDTRGFELGKVHVRRQEANTGLTSRQRAVRIAGDQAAECRIARGKTFVKRRLCRDTCSDRVFNKNREVVDANRKTVSKARRPNDTEGLRVCRFRICSRGGLDSLIS